MNHSKGCTFVFAALALVACGASAQKIVPSPLLAIDQNRVTVVDRIVSEWGEPLAQSSAALSPEQLRTILSELRSDHLLAASLAGNLDGLRNVLANALTSTAPVKASRIQIAGEAGCQQVIGAQLRENRAQLLR